MASISIFKPNDGSRPEHFHQQQNGKKAQSSSRFKGRMLRRDLPFLLLLVAATGISQQQTLGDTSYQYSTIDTYYKNLTVVVPGFGDMSRMPVLKQSLKTIQSSLEAKHYGFDCLVYVYKQEVLSQASSELSFCQVLFNTGLWTHHMKKVPPLTTNYVAIMMDDIDLYTHRLDTAYMMDQVFDKKYNMASASFPKGSVHREGLHQRSKCTSHETGYVDILYTLYDLQTWNCWQAMIDLDVNPYGWGYDVLVADVCHAKIGVIDKRGVAIHVTHPCLVPGGCRKSSYDTNAARTQMEQWIAQMAQTHDLIDYPSDVEAREITPSEAAMEYRGKVLERWKNYPQCD